MARHEAAWAEAERLIALARSTGATELSLAALAPQAFIERVIPVVLGDAVIGMPEARLGDVKFWRARKNTTRRCLI
jgi:hypothetical protein